MITVLKKLIRKEIKDENDFKQLIMKSDYTITITIPEWISQLENSL